MRFLSYEGTLSLGFVNSINKDGKVFRIDIWIDSMPQVGNVTLFPKAADHRLGTSSNTLLILVFA